MHAHTYRMRILFLQKQCLFLYIGNSGCSSPLPTLSPLSSSKAQD